MKAPKLSSVVWLTAWIVIPAAIAVVGFLVHEHGVMTYEFETAELTLRRGISVATSGESDSLIELHVDTAASNATPPTVYTLEFVDAFPVDLHSFWSFVRRSGYVWTIRGHDGQEWEGEVRPRPDWPWAVLLTRRPATAVAPSN